SAISDGSVARTGWPAVRALRPVYAFVGRTQCNRLRRRRFTSIRRRAFPFDHGRVPPQIFKAVEGSLVAMKNVDNHLQVIEYHPLTGGKSVNGYRPQRIVFSQP